MAMAEKMLEKAAGELTLVELEEKVRQAFVDTFAKFTYSLRSVHHLPHRAPSRFKAGVALPSVYCRGSRAFAA